MARPFGEIVQALPQEIQDIIFELAVTIEPSTVNITQAHALPIGLSINHNIREKTAAIYYGTSVFLETPAHLQSRNLFDWLSSVPPHHRPLIKQVRRQAELGTFSF